MHRRRILRRSFFVSLFLGLSFFTSTLYAEQYTPGNDGDDGDNATIGSDAEPGGNGTAGTLTEDIDFVSSVGIVGGHGGEGGNGGNMAIGKTDAAAGGAAGSGTVVVNKDVSVEFLSEMFVGGKGGYGGKAGIIHWRDGYHGGRGGDGGKGGDGEMTLNGTSTFRGLVHIGGSGGKGEDGYQGGGGIAGTGGKGTLNISGSTEFKASLFLGGNGGNGGSATAGSIATPGGDAGTGTVSISDGTQLFGNLMIGGVGGEGGLGTSTNSGCGGKGGSGTLKISKGTVTVGGIAVIGHRGGIGGDAYGSWNADAGGDGGSGNVEITGGATTFKQETHIGFSGGEGGGTEYYEDDGPGGVGGEGTLKVSSGSVVFEQTLRVGGAGGAGGGEEGVGGNGAEGNFKITGGSVTLLADTFVGGIAGLGGGGNGTDGRGEFHLHGGNLVLGEAAHMTVRGDGKFGAYDGTLTTLPGTSFITAPAIEIENMHLQLDRTGMDDAAPSLVLGGPASSSNVITGMTVDVRNLSLFAGQRVTLLDFGTAISNSSHSLLIGGKPVSVGRITPLRPTLVYPENRFVQLFVQQIESDENSRNTTVTWNVDNGVWDNDAADNWIGSITTSGGLTYEVRKFLDGDTVVFEGDTPAFAATKRTVTVAEDVIAESITVRHGGSYVFGAGNDVSSDITITVTGGLIVEANTSLSIDSPDAAGTRNLNMIVNGSAVVDGTLAVLEDNRAGGIRFNGPLAFGAASRFTVNIRDDGDANRPALTLADGTDLSVSAGSILDINSYLPGAKDVLIETTGAAFASTGWGAEDVHVGGKKTADTVDIHTFMSSVSLELDDGGKRIVATCGDLVWFNGENDARIAHGYFEIDTELTIAEVLRDSTADAARRTSTGDADHTWNWDGRTLTKNGPGDLILSAENTYSGGTVVNAGRIVGIGVAAFGTGPVTNDSEVELYIDANEVYDRNIGGSGSFIKSGSGTLTLSGTNTYSGGTIIEGGTLSGNTADDTDLAVASGATYKTGGAARRIDVLSGNGSIANDDGLIVQRGMFHGDISGAGGLTKTGTGDLILSGESVYSGDTRIVDGKLIATDVAALGSGDVTVDPGKTLEFQIATDDDNLFLNDIGGGGNVVKSGTGTLFLLGDNENDGGIRLAVEAGTLTVARLESLGGNDVSTFADAGIEIVLIEDDTFAKAFHGNGDLTKSGPGTLTLAGQNTLAGTTTVYMGMLALGTGGTLDRSDVHVTQGTTLDVSSESKTLQSLTADTATVRLGGVDNILNVTGNAEFVNAKTVLEWDAVGIPVGDHIFTLLTSSGFIGTEGTHYEVVAENASDNRYGSFVENNDLKLEFINGNANLTWNTDNDIWLNAPAYKKIWKAGQIETYYKDGDTVFFDGDVHGGGEARTVMIRQDLNPAGMTFRNAGAWTLQIHAASLEKTTLNTNNLAIGPGAEVHIDNRNAKPDRTGGVLDVNVVGPLSVDGMLYLYDDNYGGRVDAGSILIGSGATLGITIDEADDIDRPALLIADAADWSIAPDSRLDIHGYFYKTEDVLIEAKTGTFDLAQLFDADSIFVGGTPINQTLSLDVFVDSVEVKLNDDRNKIIASYGDLVWYNGEPNGNTERSHGTFRVEKQLALYAVLADNPDDAHYWSEPGKEWDGTSLTKTGEGTLILAAENAFTGNVHVAGGTLVAVNPNSLGAQDSGGQWSVDAGGTLEFRDFDMTIRKPLSGSGTFLKTGNGTLLVESENAGFDGRTEITAGRMILTGSLGKSDVVVDGTLDIRTTDGTANSLKTNRGSSLRLSSTPFRVFDKVDIETATELAFDHASIRDGRMQLLDVGGTVTSGVGEVAFEDGLFILKYAIEALDHDGLYARFNAVTPLPESAALPEARVATLAVLRANQDWLTVWGYGEIEHATCRIRRSTAWTTFGAFTGGRTRLRTGSHVDLNTYGVHAGMARKEGRFLYGLTFDGNWGDFDTFNETTTGGIRGKGDANAYGGSIFARWTAKYGYYFDSALYFGSSDTDLELRLEENSYRLDTSSPYVGYHFGAGRRFQMNRRHSFDTSLRYYGLYGKRDETTAIGWVPLTFSTLESHRLRLNARLIREMPKTHECLCKTSSRETARSYVGASWEYEFSGNANGDAYGTSLGAPTLRGGTGIGEIGLSVNPFRRVRHVSMNAALEGYLGKREGFSGNIGMSMNW